MTKARAKQKTKTSKIKTTTTIKATTRKTTGMGVIREQLHRLTHRFEILKVKSQASR